MADVLGDITKVADAVDKLSKDGLPIVLQHTVDPITIAELIGGLIVVMLLLALFLGIKDVIVHRIIKS